LKLCFFFCKSWWFPPIFRMKRWNWKNKILNKKIRLRDFSMHIFIGLLMGLSNNDLTFKLPLGANSTIICRVSRSKTPDSSCPWTKHPMSILILEIYDRVFCALIRCIIFLYHLSRLCRKDQQILEITYFIYITFISDLSRLFGFYFKDDLKCNSNCMSDSKKIRDDAFKIKLEYSIHF